MKIRFQADNDLDQRIVVATRRLDHAIEFQTATNLKLHGIDDSDVSRTATSRARLARQANITGPF
jgi:hypothetical protein